MDSLVDYLRPVPDRPWLAWFACVLLVTASIWGGIELQHRYERLQLQRAVVERMQRVTRVSAPPKPSRVELEAARRWDELRRELAFSWYPIFAALEHTSSPDIALVEFLPDKSSGTLTLHGNARNVEALIAYLNALAGERAFESIYLAHQKKVQQATLTVMMFEIRLKMR